MLDNRENEINNNIFEGIPPVPPPEQTPFADGRNAEDSSPQPEVFLQPAPFNTPAYNTETYDFSDYTNYSNVNVTPADSECSGSDTAGEAPKAVHNVAGHTDYNVSNDVPDYYSAPDTVEEPFDSAFKAAPIPQTPAPDLINSVNFTIVETPPDNDSSDERIINTSQNPAGELSPAPSGRWSEPTYTIMQESLSNMYTPGPAAYDLREAAKRRTQAAAAKRRARKARRTRFVKGVCLTLVCVLLSAAATYGVTEFRIQRGDFDRPVNQVVIGGGGGGGAGAGIATPAPEYPIPIAAVNPIEEMTAEDLFLMAVNQVVGIRVEVVQPDLFASRGTPTRTSSISGSGFIISTGGYILTNYHVIETAHRANLPITVELYDGRTYQAEIIGYDDTSDVALIKIDADNLNAAAIGDSDNIRVGQSVYAIGNPFGELIFTMTDGIVSALDRVVMLDRQTINTFQFSAPVNSGNSGGPIFNIRGEVIGIVTAKVARANAEGIGFAIPINDAIDIAVDLIEHGYLTGRALIGISVQTITRGLAEYYGVVEGARVQLVNEGSAGETAGLLVGDIIIELGRHEVTSIETLNAARRTFRAGDTTSISVRRNGETIELTITFDEDMQAGIPR